VEASAFGKFLLLNTTLVASLLNSFAFGQTFSGLPFSEQEPVRTTASGIPPVDEEHQRILWVIPAFGVTDLQHAPPLTAKHKLALAARQAFDPFVWVSSGIQAGASQAGNEFPGYGQGISGFSKRYGATMLDSVDSGLASSAFCALLKQDPRYFRLGQGSIAQRTLYSMAQQFSAKNDDGHRQFNWANVRHARGGVIVHRLLSAAGPWLWSDNEPIRCRFRMGLYRQPG
jgi:hypothetical protein